MASQDDHPTGRPTGVAPVTQSGRSHSTQPSDPTDVTIVVCSSCRGPDASDARPRPGEKLGRAAMAANDQPGVTVELIECLGNCRRRLSAAFVKAGAWSYVFGDLDIDNAGDLIEGARLLRDSDNELMPWRGRPQCLKTGLVARIPPLNLLE